MNSDIVSYYKERAHEYEKVYLKPERQEDLAFMQEFLKKTFRNKEVFEIACGTGYWTKIIAETAQQILATDINEAVLQIAKSKEYSPTKVSFELEDIFNLKHLDKHESLFGGFIWSHVDLKELTIFIETINGLVKSGGTVVLIDNNFVEGSSTPLSEKDERGNTYQIRKLEDGTSHKVLKNFPDNNFIQKALSGKASDIEFINLKYYWILKYKTL